MLRTDPASYFEDASSSRLFTGLHKDICVIVLQCNTRKCLEHTQDSYIGKCRKFEAGVFVS